MSKEGGFYPVSLGRNQEVIEHFLSAIRIDDETKDNNSVLAVSQRYIDLGMPIGEVVILRETAYQMVEASDVDQ